MTFVLSNLAHHPDAELQAQFANFQAIWWPTVRQVMQEVIESATSDGSPLRRMFDYHLQTGGKRLRAILPLLIGQTLGASADRIVPFAASCEILHNASLVHDDIQDGDSMRRGNLTIWKKFGTAQAINLGDAMIALAILALDRLDVDLALRERLRTRMLHETLQVIEGQSIEFHVKSASAITIDDYMTIAERKTSSLFCLPVAGGAMLSGVGASVERALAASAHQIGILFQIVDDIVDLYGDKERGPSGGDIREGKRSILVTYFMQSAPSAEAEWLTNILDKPRTATMMQEVEDVRRVFQKSGALAFALDELERRRRAALFWTEIDRDSYLPTHRVLEQACAMFMRPAEAIRAKFLVGH
jgi:geranylgeranyl diphosphate synthase, type I